MKKQKITKSSLAKLGGFLTAGLLTAGAIFYQGQPTEANRNLFDFPTELPGIEKVVKYPFEDAKKTLVHIRQAHEQTGFISKDKLLERDDLTEKEKEFYESKLINRFKEINETQRDIYLTLENLVINRELREVYSEGVSREFEEKTNYLAKELCGLSLERSFSLGYFGDSLEEAKKRIYFVPGADKILASQGKIRIKGSEDADVNELSYWAKSNNGELYSKSNDLREDIALDLVSKGKNPLEVLVYGGAHKFLDNIERWNQEHPDKKYSLIELTPRSYQGREEK